MSNQKRANYVINISTGSVTPRTSATDGNPMIFRLIDDETALAIFDRKVTAWQICEAIDKNDRSAKEFNYREYSKRMQAAEKLLNVSQREMVPIQGDPNTVVEPEKEDTDVLTLSGLGLAGGEAPKSEAPKPDETETQKPSGKKKSSADKPTEESAY